MLKIKEYTRVIFKREMLLTVFIILIMSTSPISSARISDDAIEVNELINEEANHYYDFDNDQIVVFYDAEEALANSTAMSIYQSIALMTPDVLAVPVTSLEDIKMVLTSTAYFAAIYVFQSDYNGLKIHRYNQLIPWEEVSSVFESSPLTHNIMAMGNSLQLLNTVPVELLDYVHGSGDQRVDANQVFLYAMWELAELLIANDSPRRQKLGNDIRMASLQYFSDNFNDLAAASVEARAPLGEESPETVQARVDKYYEDNPAVVTKLAPDGYTVDPVTMRQVDEVTGVPRDDYVMDIFPAEYSMPTDFILDLLPIGSGQRGPIGGILDALLKYLMDEIGDAIGLDSGTVQSIVDILVSIPDLVGAISNPSGSSIKAFIDKLKPMLPIPDSMYKYVDLLIDGLFVLRGSEDDIKNFITNAIGMIIPDMSIAGIQLKDMVAPIFDLGNGLIEKINAGGNVMDIILSLLNENIVKDLIGNYIGNSTVLGFSVTEIPKIVNKLDAGFKLIINTISSGNMKDLIFDYGPEVIGIIFDSLNIDQKYIEIIFQGIGVVMDAAGMMKGNGLDNMKDLVADMLRKIKGNVENSTIYKAADKIVKSVGQLIEGKFSELTVLTANVTQALSALGVDSNTVKAIQDLATIVVAVAKPDFDISGISSLTTMIENFLKSFNIGDANIISSVKTILDGLFGIIAYIKDVPSFKKIVGDVMSGSDITTSITKTVKEIINLVKDNFFSSQLNVNNPLGVDYVTSDDTTTKDGVVDMFSSAVGMLMQLLNGFKGNSFQGIMSTLLQSGTFL